MEAIVLNRLLSRDATDSPRVLLKWQLPALLDLLRANGYRVVGPRVSSGAIVYEELQPGSELPQGWVDRQDGGTYRIQQDERAGYFDYAVGPHSLKPFVFPPRETLVQLEKCEQTWKVEYPVVEREPLAVLGVRSCDLHALAIQDRVFLEGPYQDAHYRARRERLFLIVVQCRRAVATCFCHSMGTGPRAESGFDWALTELDDRFVLEIGSEQGESLASQWADVSDASEEECQRAERQSADLAATMHQRTGLTVDSGEPRDRSLNTEGIRDLLLSNLDHARWDHVADRCLSCTNCTMVCPTCFCSSVQEVTDLTGDQVTRERHWDSCFTAEHSRMSTGVVRATTKARYRQWLTHKLASWIDQYGQSGCVGCGRCITWCPVGIDLTEEVAAIRGDDR